MSADFNHREAMKYPAIEMDLRAALVVAIAHHLAETRSAIARMLALGRSRRAAARHRQA